MEGSSALYKYIKHNHDAKISPGLKLYAHNDTSALDATPFYQLITKLWTTHAFYQIITKKSSAIATIKNMPHTYNTSHVMSLIINEIWKGLVANLLKHFNRRGATKSWQIVGKMGINSSSMVKNRKNGSWLDQAFHRAPLVHRKKQQSSTHLSPCA